MVPVKNCPQSPGGHHSKGTILKFQILKILHRYWYISTLTKLSKFFSPSLLTSCHVVSGKLRCSWWNYLQVLFAHFHSWGDFSNGSPFWQRVCQVYHRFWWEEYCYWSCLKRKNGSIAHHSVMPINNQLGKMRNGRSLSSCLNCNQEKDNRKDKFRVVRQFITWKFMIMLMMAMMFPRSLATMMTMSVLTMGPPPKCSLIRWWGLTWQLY